VDGPTAAGDRVRADSREVDSLEDDATAALFPAAVSRAAVGRVAAAAARAVPVLGACGRGAPAVPVLGARAGDVPQAAGDVLRAAADVRRCLPRVLLPVQAGLAGCPAAAADDPGRATRVAASRRHNRRDCRRLARTTAGRIVSPSLWFPFQVLEERRKGRRFQGRRQSRASICLRWMQYLGGRALPPMKTAFARSRWLRREGNPL
jgi:hypothetical protein